jgi:hypothetical protein
MNLRHSISEAKWWVLHRLVPKHRYHVVNTGLRPGYHDIDERILHASMALLCDYVEAEGGDVALEEFSAALRASNDAPRQASNQDEAVAIYRWWKRERPADLARYDELLMRLYGPDPLRSAINGAADEELRSLGKKIRTDEQSMLRRLVEIRQSLWT